MTLAPGKIWPGTPIRLTNVYTDSNGDLTDPSTVSIYIQDPAGNQSSYVYGTGAEVGRAAAGSYYADITLTKGGRWFYRWLTAGGVIANEGDILVQRSPFVDDLDPQAYRR